MKLYTTGVKVPKLGSLHDRMIQSYFLKESEKEIKKTQLLTFLAMNTIPATTKEGIQEYEGKIKKAWVKYLELEYGVKLPEKTEKEIILAEYYEKVVKRMKPKLIRKKGRLIVQGLEPLQK